MKLLEGKVALVTGAGGGIGLATTYAFARAGTSVIMADNNESLLESTSADIRRRLGAFTPGTCLGSIRKSMQA